MAGLAKLRPNPPKTSLPNSTATTAPTAAIQNGTVGGSESASSQQVTKFAIEIACPLWREVMNSVTRPTAQVTTSTPSTRQPNEYIPAIRIGTSA